MSREEKKSRLLDESAYFRTNKSKKKKYKTISFQFTDKESMVRQLLGLCRSIRLL